MQLRELLVELLDRETSIFLSQLKHFEHFPNLVIMILNLAAKVKRKSKRHVVRNLLPILLAPHAHIMVELVFVSQSTMPLNMINDLLVPKFAQTLKLNPLRRRFPLEIEQLGDLSCLFPISGLLAPTPAFLLRRVLCGLSALVLGRASGLEHEPDSLGIVPGQNAKFEVSDHLVLALRQLGVLFECVSSLLVLAFGLPLQFLRWVHQAFWGELLQVFFVYGFLVLFYFFVFFDREG